MRRKNFYRQSSRQDELSPEADARGADLGGRCGFGGCFGKELKAGLKAVCGTAKDLLFPMGTYCVCCGNFIDGSREYSLCDHCIRHIGWGHAVIDLAAEAEALGRESCLDSARACMSYGLYSRRLIFELKYNGRTYVAGVLGRILYDRIRSDEEAWAQLMTADFVVPVPIHKAKMRTRGFNQTEKMGRHLAKFMGEAQKDAGLAGVRLCAEGLERVKETAAQRSITGEERYFNLFGAFAVSEAAKGELAGSRVILVDDVYTTGATAHVCAGALKAAGVCRVDLVTVATGNDFASGFFEGTELKK